MRLTSPPRPRSLRGARLAARLLAGAAALLPALPGCASPGKPVRAVGAVGQESPQAAYEYVKSMVAAAQPAAEWEAFSPGFKRRLSEQVGRTVDVGDYAHARATIASNATKEIKLLLESEFVKEDRLSDDVSIVTIRAGGRQATPRFVRLWTFEVRFKGEAEPVSEFIPGPDGVVDAGGDGSIRVNVIPSDGTRAYLKEIRKDRFESFTIRPQWYLDDFGGVEDAVANGLTGGGTPPPAAPPRGGGRAPGSAPRGSPAPGPRPTAPPSGSPDGDPGSPG